MAHGRDFCQRRTNTHEPLNSHPVRQEVHFAQERTVIDCSALKESWEVVGEFEPIHTLGTSEGVSVLLCVRSPECV